LSVAVFECCRATVLRVAPELKHFVQEARVGSERIHLLAATLAAFLYFEFDRREARKLVAAGHFKDSLIQIQSFRARRIQR
jgi:hypothetical protein